MSEISDLVELLESWVEYAEHLEGQRAEGGKSSWQNYKPVYDYALDFYAEKLLDHGKYQVRTAARKVHSHCMNNRDQFEYVPKVETIENHLREAKRNMERILADAGVATLKEYIYS